MKEVPTPQQGAADATARKCQRHEWKFPTMCLGIANEMFSDS